MSLCGFGGRWVYNGMYKTICLYLFVCFILYSSLSFLGFVTTPWKVCQRETVKNQGDIYDLTVFEGV